MGVPGGRGIEGRSIAVMTLRVGSSENDKQQKRVGDHCATMYICAKIR